tara:strand:+ start:1923 stop:2840 length:918 start_codon:yes stop_codon:yes gene_type:complete
MKKNSCIYIAGHNGLVGNSITRALKKNGYTNLLTINRSELDLTNSDAVSKFFSVNKIEYVFDAAAKVGGIKANDNYSAEFIFENTMIQTNLIHYSYKNNIKKILFLGSVCIYPKFAPTPIKEESLLCGELEPTNEAYAIAKIHGIQLLKSYYKQFGLKSVSLMPCNLYGSYDNYHPNNSHVIPGLLRKFHHASGEMIECWGDGTPLREFLYVDDFAEACLVAMLNYEKAEIINVGSGSEITIKDLANLIAEITGFKGKIYWDKTSPNGTPKRLLDSSKIKSLGWEPKYKLKEGLQLEYEWYKDNY